MKAKIIIEETINKRFFLQVEGQGIGYIVQKNDSKIWEAVAQNRNLPHLGLYKSRNDALTGAVNSLLETYVK